MENFRWSQTRIVILNNWFLTPNLGLYLIFLPEFRHKVLEYQMSRQKFQVLLYAFNGCGWWGRQCPCDLTITSFRDAIALMKMYVFPYAYWEQSARNSSKATWVDQSRSSALSSYLRPLCIVSKVNSESRFAEIRDYQVRERLNDDLKNLYILLKQRIRPFSSLDCSE